MDLPDYKEGTPRRIPFYEEFRKREFAAVGKLGSSAGLDNSFVSPRKCTYGPSGEGVYWGRFEKLRFFNLLARHSIHRLDLVYEGMGRTKSKSDIMAYYRLLKREAKRLNKRKNKRDARVRMEEFPIAYEMSESFLELEEYQAWATREVCTQEKEFMHAMYANTVTDSLVDANSAHAISQELFAHNNITSNNQSGLNLGPAAVDALNEHAKLLTRQIVTEIIENKLQEFAASNDVSVDIIADDVAYACHTLGLSAKRPTKFTDYWQNVIPRLNLHVHDDTGVTVNPGWTATEYEQWVKSMQNKALIRLENLSKPTDEIEVDSDPDVETSLKVWEMKDETPPISIQSVSRNIPKDVGMSKHDADNHPDEETEKEVTPTPGDDSPEVTLEEHIEERIFLNETAALERHDMLESRKYEHVLLTAMTTLDSPYLFPVSSVAETCNAVHTKRLRSEKRALRRRIREKGYSEDDVWDGNNFDTNILDRVRENYTRTYADYLD